VWGAATLGSYYAPLAVQWLHGVINLEHATLCGLKPWADGIIASRPEWYAERKHKGVYRLLWDGEDDHTFPGVLMELVWVALVVCITPALLAVQSALYSTQLMALKSVAKGWSRIMGLPLYRMGDDDAGGTPAPQAGRFDKGAWNRARLMEIVLEALPSVVLQAVGLSIDAKDGVSSSGIAIVSFTMSTLLLVCHCYEYAHKWWYYGVAPLEYDPSVNYRRQKRKEDEAQAKAATATAAPTAPVGGPGHPTPLSGHSWDEKRTTNVPDAVRAGAAPRTPFNQPTNPEPQEEGELEFYDNDMYRKHPSAPL
jgi:hypothetical protein